MGKRVAAGLGALNSRHLRWESFESRIHKGPPSVEPISGSPRAQLIIEPSGRRIGARFFGKTAGTVLSPLAEVTIREVGIGSETALEISTGNPDLYRDFYALCCSIADRVQIEKEPIFLAVKKTLAAWSALIRRKPLFSSQEQIGLLGELLFIRRAARSLGWPTAAAAWYGPSSEEHDFVLPAVDVEVKATTSEQRIHQITSLTQLLPKDQRALQFVSVQLTLGGEGVGAFSLSEFVGTVLSTAQRAAAGAADAIRDHLRVRGWIDEDAPNYAIRYRLRAPMLTASVSTDFPAIVPETLRCLGSESLSRIDRVSYSIKVDGLGVLDGSKKFEEVLFQRRKS